MAHHHEIRARQVEKLRELRGQSVRNDLLDDLLDRRATSAKEPPERGGRRRPALSAVPAADRPGDRVAVERAGLLVRADDGRDTRDEVSHALDGESFVLEDVCGQFVRVELDDESARDRALELLDNAPVRASRNHVAMMGGTAKGGATPKATTEDVETTEAPPAEPRGGPLVVVIDTGIDADAEVREDRWVHFVATADANANSEDVDPLDVLNPAGKVNPDGKLDLAAGHGTFVAGIVGQVAPTADVVMIRALTTDGVCTEDELVRALCRAADVFEDRRRTIGVVNLSLGLETEDDREPPLLRAAIDLLPEDVIVVAAAGNAATGTKLWPAAFDHVCGVASLGDGTTPSTWSNFGDWIDFSARGEGIISTFVEGRETGGAPPFDPVPDKYEQPDPLAVWSGTSFATPQVAGRLANIIADNPGLSGAQVVQELEQNVTPIQGFGHPVPTL